MRVGPRPAAERPSLTPPRMRVEPPPSDDGGEGLPPLRPLLRTELGVPTGVAWYRRTVEGGAGVDRADAMAGLSATHSPSPPAHLAGEATDAPDPAACGLAGDVDVLHEDVAAAASAGTRPPPGASAQYLLETLPVLAGALAGLGAGTPRWRVAARMEDSWSTAGVMGRRRAAVEGRGAGCTRDVLPTARPSTSCMLPAS